MRSALLCFLVLLLATRAYGDPLIGGAGYVTIEVKCPTGAWASDAYIDFDKGTWGVAHAAFMWNSTINFKPGTTATGVQGTGPSTLAYNNGTAANNKGGIFPGPGTTFFTYSPFVKDDLPIGGTWYGRNPTTLAPVRGSTMRFALKKITANYDGHGWLFATDDPTENLSVWNKIAFFPHDPDSPRQNYVPADPINDWDELSTASTHIGGAEWENTEGNGYTALTMQTPRRGDANTDFNVNFDDLAKLAQSYNLTGTTWQTGDFNGDGATDFSDLVAMSQNYNTSNLLQSFDSPPPDGWVNVDGTLAMVSSMSRLEMFNRDASSLGLPAVPEPSSAFVLLAGLLLARRRRA